MANEKRKRNGRGKSAERLARRLSRRKPIAEERMAGTGSGRRCGCDGFMLADKGGCDCEEKRREAARLNDLRFGGGASLGY